jgi:ATP-dependent exoDNAse (exonuclease V) alpha subunit
VLRVKARGQRDLVTIVGHAAAIGAGEFVHASGRWINDRTHGVQFRADFLRAAPPTIAEGIEKYLASGMIKGIGPIYAKKLVKAFREAVFDVIEQQPRRLESVMGGDYNDMHTCSHFHRRSIMNNTAMIAGGYGSRRAAMKQTIAASEDAVRRWFQSVQRATYSGQ